MTINQKASATKPSIKRLLVYKVSKIIYHVQPTTMTHKRNRRFKRNVILNKRTEKRKRYRARKKENKQQVKQNAPYQIAINLSKIVLYEEQNSILVKCPSFLSIPSDINWYEVRKYFTKFIKEVRQHPTATNQPSN